jgi:hypothetical protein
MPVAIQYREYANKCLQLAESATPVDRAHLLRVAKTWLQIAAQTEAQADSLSDADLPDGA